MKNFKVATHDPRTLSWWLSHRHQIDMGPPYQRRGRLWSPTDKAYLIDSILNGFDVPKIYMADFTWGNSQLNQKSLPYAIIDGKQRFEAIFDFYDGKVTLNDDFEYLDAPVSGLGGLSYQDLQSNHSRIAEEFDNYCLLVMSVVAKTEEPINELFVRLNRSKSLTGAEIRNAMSGPAPEVIRQIANHDFFTTNVNFSVKRGQDLNAAAKVLMFAFNDRISETKKRNLDEFVLRAKNESPERLELAARHVVDVLDTMSEIFLPSDRLLSSSGIVPVYYWFICSCQPELYRLVREFLNNFEKTRKENRSLVNSVPGSRKIDSELVEYDQFNRSTNDLQSHSGRYELLVDRFHTFVESRQ